MTSTITVIIPTFNRPKKLENAINSVLVQTYKNFKILILDNSTNNETELLIRNKYSNIFYHKHESNIGGVKNFEFGLKLVNSDFFCFLSDDDIYLPNFFQLAINSFVNHCDIGYFAGEVVYEDNDNNYIGQSNKFLKPGYISLIDGLSEIIKNTNPPCWTGIVFKTDVLNIVGYIDLEVGGSFDYDFVNRVSAYFPFFVSTEIVAKFNVDPESWGHSSNYNYIWPSWNKMIFNILNINTIELNTKFKFYKYYNNYYKKKIFLYARQNIKNKKYISAEECASILKNYFNSYYHFFIIKFGILIFKRSKLLLDIFFIYKKIKNKKYK